MTNLKSLIGDYNPCTHYISHRCCPKRTAIHLGYMFKLESLSATMQQDLRHQDWTIIADFLSRADRFALIGLCRSVVHSPLRAAFFAKTTWRVPPIEILATKVLRR